MTGGPALTGRAAVFLDRDGVLIHDSRNYIRSIDDVRLIAGAAEAVRLLNDHDVPAIVVTNQSAVARGYITEADLHAINQRMFDLIAATPLGRETPEERDSARTGKDVIRQLADSPRD